MMSLRVIGRYCANVIDDNASNHERFDPRRSLQGSAEVRVSATDQIPNTLFPPCLM